MKRFSALCITAWAVFATPIAWAGQESILGRKAQDFSLMDFRGKKHTLSDYKDQKVVVLAFLGVECPLAKMYAPRLAEMADKYASKGVVFLGVDSNQQDSIAELAAFARDHGVKFPLLKDAGNLTADQLGAARTPEVFVLDADRAVCYHGRVDDQYGFTSGSGYAKTKMHRPDLATALDEVLAGKTVSLPETKATGCLIGRVRQPKEDSSVTYSKQIARILQNQCTDCHRPGEVAPFSLTSYEEAVGWAGMIDEVVSEQRMPPWHADPKYGHWSNERRLSEDDKKAIHEWVVAGAPKGDPKDLPEPKKYVDGWAIPTPDHVFNITEKPVPVPAEGTVQYKYFTIDPQLKNDVWVKMADCRPGNRQVVHHIICFVQPPGTKAKFEGNEPMNVWLLHGYAPGMPAQVMPDGMAMHIPAGSKFVFQMHYTPNGTATEDKSALGLIYADPKTIRQNARTDNAINPYIKIPPGADNHPIKAERRFPRDTQLVSLMPHMHLRGKAFKYELKYPDGKTETILDVPRYDFNWQNVYYFTEPKKIPAGTTMHCTAHFDNSAENLFNPDPTKTVFWGDQTWEEMMIGWFTMTNDVNTESNWPGGSRTERFVEGLKKDAAKSDRVMRFAAKARKSTMDWGTFSRGLVLLAPQIDRVDVATVDGDKVVFAPVSQPAVFDAVVGKADDSLPIDSCSMAEIAEQGQPVAIDDLHDRTEPDLARMSAMAASSYHVPIKIKGKPAVVSFYSRESKAFPPEAQKVLEPIAKKLAGD